MPDGQAEQRCHAADLLTLNLTATELVTLASCSTGAQALRSCRAPRPWASVVIARWTSRMAMALAERIRSQSRSRTLKRTGLGNQSLPLKALARDQ